MRLYVGTYSSADSAGIHRLRFDERRGTFEYEAGYAGVEQPSYVLPNASGTALYAASETNDGKVAAFAIEPGSGALRPLNVRSTGGGAPCHLALSRDGRLLFAANYAGGSVAVVPLEADGSLAERSELRVHEGRGARADRQEAPHPHSANVDPSGRYVVVPDLGIDRLVMYAIEGNGLRRMAETALPAGTGPRHLAFHPTLPAAYVAGELDNTVTVLAVEDEPFALAATQRVATLPDTFEGESTSADIHVTPDGSLLFVSNRGHDSLAAYRVDAADGRLTPIGFFPSGGRTPRNFAISPDGAFLIAANQQSDALVAFRIDPETGALEETARHEGISKPVCIRFVTTNGV